MPIVRAALDAIVEECCGNSNSTRAVRDGIALELLAADFLAGSPSPLISVCLPEISVLMPRLTVPKNLNVDTTRADFAAFLWRAAIAGEFDPEEWLSEAAIEEAASADPEIEQQRQLALSQQEVKRLNEEVERLNAELARRGA